MSNQARAVTQRSWKNEAVWAALGGWRSKVTVLGEIIIPGWDSTMTTKWYASQTQSMAKTNKTYNRRVSTSLTHLAFKRLVSDSQLHVRTRFAAALLCRLSCRNTWGRGVERERERNETFAWAGTARHRATQCKDTTDGHHNYTPRRGFIFLALHETTQWWESGAAQRRQRCRTSWQAGLQAGRRPGRLAKLCLSLFSNFSMLAFDS